MAYTLTENNRKVRLMAIEIKLVWDFYGPRAEGTAQHHRRHVDEFIRNHKLEGCETAVETLGPNHSCAISLSGPESAEFLRSRLRPHQILQRVDDSPDRASAGDDSVNDS